MSEPPTGIILAKAGWLDERRHLKGVCIGKNSRLWFGKHRQTFDSSFSVRDTARSGWVKLLVLHDVIAGILLGENEFFVGNFKLVKFFQETHAKQG